MLETNRQRKILSWTAVGLWMALIFYLSHQSGESSSDLSIGVMKIVLSVITFVIPTDFDVNQFHLFIRKSAHFFAYFILGVLVINALKRDDSFRWMEFGYAVIICVVYAMLDEFHQTFIPGRSGEVRDVIIDGFGSLCGIAVYEFILVKFVKFWCKGSKFVKKIKIK